MRIEYLAAIAIVAAGAGLAVHSVGSLPPEKQPTPAAARLRLQKLAMGQQHSQFLAA